MFILIIVVVPSVPQVQIIPSYSNDGQIFEKLFILTTMNKTVKELCL